MKDRSSCPRVIATYAALFGQNTPPYSAPLFHPGTPWPDTGGVPIKATDRLSLRSFHEYVAGHLEPRRL